MPPEKSGLAGWLGFGLGFGFGGAEVGRRATAAGEGSDCALEGMGVDVIPSNRGKADPRECASRNARA